MLDLATNSLSGELPLNLFNLTAYIFGRKVVGDCTLGGQKVRSVDRKKTRLLRPCRALIT
jgi:hypothetical protein